MQEQQKEIIGPITVKGNGLTSFVPPCFRWDLKDASENIFEVVSDVTFLDWPTDPQSDSIKKNILKGSIPVKGYIEKYHTGMCDEEDGKRFIIVSFC